MKNSRLLFLLEKYQRNACSTAELNELIDWYSSINNEYQAIEDSVTTAFPEEMFLEFKSLIQSNPPAIPLFKKKLVRFAAAASLILLVVSFYYIRYSSKNTPIYVRKNSITVGADISAPQKVMAMITLSNGQKIPLDSFSSGNTIQQSGVDIVRTADGKILYYGNTEELLLNVLSNPRGSKTVSIALNDGSKVWLNSGSSIEYPVSFVGKEKVVEIKGEAYFEVAKNPNKKFVVKSNGVSTEVFGTHFNINSYDDDNNVKITLLEGSVKVSKGAITGFLKPGQQAKITNQLQIDSHVDQDAVMAWKNGFFHFENTEMEELMKQLSRWYGIDIVYKKGIPNRTFGGEIARDANLSQLVRILNESKVKCNIEGKQLIIE